MPPPPEPPGAPDATRRDKRASKRAHRAALVAIVLLGLALAAAVAVLVFSLIELDEANARIQEQELELEERRQLIDKKETFVAAMEGLMTRAGAFDGVLMTSMVPLDRYQAYASRGWAHRWNPSALDRDIADIRVAATHLEDLLTAAKAEATTNSTGTRYESVIDRLGGGFVASVIDDADTLCEADVLACVSSDDPFTIHFDAADNSLPYMTDWLRTGLAYHEFAHVLQMTNPELTEAARASFGDDDEKMADCFTLVYLDGWQLDHRIWMNDYEYWDVSIGYGHVCDQAQRQAVRDWYEQLGVQLRPITQQG